MYKIWIKNFIYCTVSKSCFFLLIVTEYSITVYTTNILWAGTDANVFLEIRNKKGDSTGEFQLRGDFEAGRQVF